MQSIAKIPLFTRVAPDGTSVVFGINRNASPHIHSKLIEQSNSEVRVQINGNIFRIILRREPIDPDVLAACCVLSSWWRDAQDELTGHSAHLVIANAENAVLDRVGEAVLATHLAAELLKLTAAPGIYWGDGILNSASDFIELAASVRSDNLNASLWINVKAYECDDGSFKLSTFGLAAFDQPDIEVDSFISNNPGQVIGRVCNLIERLLLGQVALLENERVRWGDVEEVFVTFGSSFMNPDDCVAKLHL